MISKILFHIYALYVIAVLTFLGLENIGFHQAMFKTAQAQAIAIVMLYQRMVGT